MIDEKVIKEAARAYVDATYGTLKEEPFIAEGFKQGAIWAQMEFTGSLWHNARKYKPTDIEGYKCGDFLALRIEYPTHHEFDVITGWYDTVHSKFVIPERFPNHKRYIIKAFSVLPKFKEGGEK